jgi:hypothetical protein
MHYEKKLALSKMEVHSISFGPEYVKVFLESSVFAFGICNFSLTTFRRESKDFYQTSTGFYFLNI